MRPKDAEDLLSKITSLFSDDLKPQRRQRLSVSRSLASQQGTIHGRINKVCSKGHQRTSSLAQQNQLRCNRPSVPKGSRRSRRIAQKRKPLHQCSRCHCQTCADVIAAQATPRFEKGDSTIAGAGQGLFAAEDIKGGTFLGEYKGKVRNESEDDDNDDDKVTGFTISTSKLETAFISSLANTFKSGTFKAIRNSPTFSSSITRMTG